LDALGRQGKIQERIDRWGQGAQVLFLGLGRLFAITGTVAGRWRLSWRTELAVFDAIGRQWILGQALPRLVDFQPVAVFQDLNRNFMDAKPFSSFFASQVA
jgi:hypothetical protein